MKPSESNNPAGLCRQEKNSLTTGLGRLRVRDDAALQVDFGIADVELQLDLVAVIA